MAWSLHELGNIASARGELEQAERLLEDAMALFQKLGREVGTFRTLVSLGHLKRAQGNSAESMARYKKALAIW